MDIIALLHGVPPRRLWRFFEEPILSTHISHVTYRLKTLFTDFKDFSKIAQRERERFTEEMRQRRGLSCAIGPKLNYQPGRRIVRVVSI